MISEGTSVPANKTKKSHLPTMARKRKGPPKIINNQPANSLKIIQHNVRNFTTNKKQLYDFWETQKPDVILLNSVCLGNEDKPNRLNYISHNNYKTYYTDKGKHNGSAILVKKSIRHILVKTGNNQLLAITLYTHTGPVTLSTFYRVFDKKKPNHKIPHQQISHLFSKNHPVFLLGNLNMKHTCFGHKNQRKTNDNNNKRKRKKDTNAMDSNAEYIRRNVMQYLLYHY